MVLVVRVVVAAIVVAVEGVMGGSGVFVVW